MRWGSAPRYACAHAHPFAHSHTHEHPMVTPLWHRRVHAEPKVAMPTWACAPSDQLASPHRASPRRASPRLTAPRLTAPRLASPRLASPRPGRRSHALLLLPTSYFLLPTSYVLLPTPYSPRATLARTTPGCRPMRIARRSGSSRIATPCLPSSRAAPPAPAQSPFSRRARRGSGCQAIWLRSARAASRQRATGARRRTRSTTMRTMPTARRA